METVVETKFFATNDAAKVCSCSGATVKRVADEMRLPVIKTVGGIRLLTESQVTAIAAELQRRIRER